jgi:hypothetical protein
VFGELPTFSRLLSLNLYPSREYAPGLQNRSDHGSSSDKWDRPTAAICHVLVGGCRGRNQTRKSDSPLVLGGKGGVLAAAGLWKNGTGGICIMEKKDGECRQREDGAPLYLYLWAMVVGAKRRSRNPGGGVILGGCRVDKDWNGEVNLEFA